MSTEIKYHIKITREETEGDTSLLATGAKGVSYSSELLSIRTDEDPTKAIMRLLSQDPPKSRADKGGTHRKSQEAAK